jgi:hypothetical protein
MSTEVKDNVKFARPVSLGLNVIRPILMGIEVAGNVLEHECLESASKPYNAVPKRANSVATKSVDGRLISIIYLVSKIPPKPSYPTHTILWN